MRREENLFCFYYANFGNALLALKKAGINGKEIDAVTMLRRKKIRKQIAEYQKITNTGDVKTLVEQGLRRLAFSSNADGVHLALHGDNMSPGQLEQLDFYGISHIKYQPEKGCEIKFYDRFKALEQLLLINSGDGDSGDDFYRALMDSVSAPHTEETDTFLGES